MNNEIYKYLYDMAGEAGEDLDDVIIYCKHFREMCKNFLGGRLHADTFRSKAEEQERALLEAVVTLCAVADKVMAVREWGPEMSQALKDQKALDEGVIGQVIEIGKQNAAGRRNPRSKPKKVTQ